MVTDFLDAATPDSLAEERQNPWGDDWRPSVRRLHPRDPRGGVAHLRYIRRDLATLA